MNESEACRLAGDASGISGGADFRCTAGCGRFARGVAWLYQSYVFVGILRPKRRKKAQGSDAPVLNLLLDRHFAWLPVPRDDCIRFFGVRELRLSRLLYRGGPGWSGDAAGSGLWRIIYIVHRKSPMMAVTSWQPLGLCASAKDAHAHRSSACLRAQCGFRKGI
jgi:hypothetical protein